MFQEPVSREICHLLQFPGAFEQMLCARDDFKLCDRAGRKRSHRLPVEAQHRVILTADNEQRGRVDMPQRLRPGEIRAPAP